MTAIATVSPPSRESDGSSSWKTVRAASWTWLIRPDACAELARHPALRPDQNSAFGWHALRFWEGRGPAALATPVEDSGTRHPATIVKHGPHRTVSRFETETAEFYLKRFHQPDWKARLRHWLRGSQARWEFSRFRLTRQLGIPTAEVVAIGRENRFGGESGLITRGIAGVVQLDDWFAAHHATLEFRRRRELMEQVASLAARLHRRGGTHRDLHAGNLLVRDDSTGFQLWMVDVSPLRFRRRTARWSDIGENLGRLRHSLLRYLSATDQAAFFRAYWREFTAERSDSGWSVRGGGLELSQGKSWNRRLVLRELTQRCEAVARSSWDQMDRKWSRGNRRTFIRETPTVRFRGLAGLGRELLEELARSPQQLLSSAHGLPPVPSPLAGEAGRRPDEGNVTALRLKSGYDNNIAGTRNVLTNITAEFATPGTESSRVAARPLSLTLSPGAGARGLERSLPVNVLTRRTPSQSWRTAEFSWARRCWEIGHALHRRLIAAPAPVWMAESLESDGVAQILALQHEPGWQPLSSTVDSLAESELRELENRALELLRRCHDLGFTHDRLALDAFDIRFDGSRPAVRFAALDPIRRRSLTQPERLEQVRRLASVLSRRGLAAGTELPVQRAA